jgi:hypothetical protein
MKKAIIIGELISTELDCRHLLESVGWLVEDRPDCLQSPIDDDIGLFIYVSKQPLTLEIAIAIAEPACHSTGTHLVLTDMKQVIQLRLSGDGDLPWLTSRTPYSPTVLSEVFSHVYLKALRELARNALVNSGYHCHRTNTQGF